MPEGERSALAVGVLLRNAEQIEGCKHLRRERLVELDPSQVGPGQALPEQHEARGLGAGDAEEVRVRAGDRGVDEG